MSSHPCKLVATANSSQFNVYSSRGTVSISFLFLAVGVPSGGTRQTKSGVHEVLAVVVATDRHMCCRDLVREEA